MRVVTVEKVRKWWINEAEYVGDNNNVMVRKTES